MMEWRMACRGPGADENSSLAGARLHLSDHTVKNQLFHIFEKLGISNRVELVLYAVSQSKPPAMSVSRDDSPAVMSGNQTE
jgi:hypothetical protein